MIVSALTLAYIGRFTKKWVLSSAEARGIGFTGYSPVVRHVHLSLTLLRPVSNVS
jgi:hypothetical protein